MSPSQDCPGDERKEATKGRVAGYVRVDVRESRFDVDESADPTTRVADRFCTQARDPGPWIACAGTTEVACTIWKWSFPEMVARQQRRMQVRPESLSPFLNVGGLRNRRRFVVDYCDLDEEIRLGSNRMQLEGGVTFCESLEIRRARIWGRADAASHAAVRGCFFVTDCPSARAGSMRLRVAASECRGRE